MKLFKRKYKRSAWFEGLLEAERMYNDGYVHRGVDRNLDYFWYKLEDSYVGFVIQGNHNRMFGAQAYINHYEKFLK